MSDTRVIPILTTKMTLEGCGQWPKRRSIRASIAQVLELVDKLDLGSSALVA